MARLTNEQVTKLLYNSLDELDKKLKEDIKSRDNNTEELKYYSEAISEKLRKIKKTKLQVDAENIKTIKEDIQELKSELEELRKEVSNTKKAIRSDLSDLNELNVGRVPNYVIILIAFMFFASIVIIWASLQ